MYGDEFIIWKGQFIATKAYHNSPFVVVLDSMVSPLQTEAPKKHQPCDVQGRYSYYKCVKFNSWWQLSRGEG